MDVKRRIIKGKDEVGWPRQCSPEKVTTLRPIPSRGSGRKCSEAIDSSRRRVGRLSVTWVLCEREESKGGAGGFLKPWRLSGTGQKKGEGRGGGGCERIRVREKEGEKGGLA
jgi:hypothetical protein